MVCSEIKHNKINSLYNWKLKFRNLDQIEALNQWQKQRRNKAGLSWFISSWYFSADTNNRCQEEQEWHKLDVSKSHSDVASHADVFRLSRFPTHERGVERVTSSTTVCVEG